MRWGAITVVVVLAITAACEPPKPVSTIDSVEVAAPPAERVEVLEPDPRACDELCRFVGNEAEEAACYSCRCKSAMDGWLPGADEIQCGLGDEVEIYRSSGDALEIATGGESTCTNPSLFQLDCGHNARFGSVRNGAATVRWLCRRLFSTIPPEPTTPYDLVGIIATNERTGATCFWDAAPFTVDETTVLPDLDLTDKTAEQHSAFAAQFYRTYGADCVICHDSDPFIYTPYLQSTWETGGWVNANYHLLSPFFDGPDPVQMRFLENETAAPCTRCHRIGEGATCTTFAPAALGVRDPLITYDGDSARFRHNIWMPDNVAEFPDRAAWDLEYAEAAQAVLDCCNGATTDARGRACNWNSLSP